MIRKPITHAENVKNAAALAQMIANRITGSSKLSAQWMQYASAEARENLAAAREDIAIEALSAAAGNNLKDKKESLSKLYNAMIRHTEIVVDVLVQADPALEKSVVDLFAAVKSTPKYAALDLVGAYDAVGAPALAAAARKAQTVQPPSPPEQPYN